MRRAAVRDAPGSSPCRSCGSPGCARPCASGSRAASSSSPVLPPCAATSAAIVSVRSKARGYGVDAELLQLLEVRAPLPQQVGLAQSSFGHQSASCSSFRTASSTPLTNPTASSPLNVRASSIASLMTTFAGVSGLGQQLVDGQPEHQPVDDRHALDAPVLRVRASAWRRSRHAARWCPRTRPLANSRSGSADARRSGVALRPVGRDRLRPRWRARPPIDRASAARLRARDGGRPRRPAHGARPARRAAARTRTDGRRRPRGRTAEPAEQHRHLDGRGRRLPALVVAAGPGPRLACAGVSVVSTPNAIGTPVSPAAVHDAVRDRRRDVFEVRRLAADHAAEADDRVEAPGLGRARAPPAEARTRPAPRTPRRPSAPRPPPSAPPARASRSAVGDRLVEARHDEREAEAGGAGKRRRRRRGISVTHGATVPLNSALRFSRKALVPSRMSSVLDTRPNSVASNTCASGNGISSPLLTASMM